MVRIISRYAEEIFSIGRDFMNAVKGRGNGRPVRLTVGFVDVVPKLLAARLLESTFSHFPGRLVRWENKLDQLLADLAIHRLDLVIADTPAPPTIRRLVPTIIGEFEDSAALKTFGQEGHGLFPICTVMEKEICQQYRVQVVRRVDSLTQKFNAITAEPWLKHPAVMAPFNTARREILT